MTAIGQVFLYCFICQRLVHVSSTSTATQCLEGQAKNTMTITCFNVDAPYIQIRNVTMGAVPLTNKCDAYANRIPCCETTSACHYGNDALYEELSSSCSGNSICKKETWTSRFTQNCNASIFSAKATYVLVQYDCLQMTPLSPNTQTPWVPPTSLVYINHLTPGEQAAFICCIMLIIVSIGAAVVIYKRIKYGPPRTSANCAAGPPEGAQ